MAITKRVQRELEQATPAAANATRKSRPTRRRRQPAEEKKSSPVQLTKAQREAVAERNKGKTWSAAEHQRFLTALDLFPSGPWKAIADYVGTKNSRQTMTHAQKYREKHERHSRGLRTKSKKKKSKKISSAKVPMRRTPRRQVRTASYLPDTATDEDEDEAHSDRDTERIEVEAEDHDQEMPCKDEEKILVKTESVPEMFDCEDFNDDFLSAFSETCTDEAASMPTATSQPCGSTLTIPDALIFASVDLWHSQSLAEMELGVDDGGSTDLEDPSDFTMALSQECW